MPEPHATTQISGGPWKTPADTARLLAENKIKGIDRTYRIPFYVIITMPGEKPDMTSYNAYSIEEAVETAVDDFTTDWARKFTVAVYDLEKKHEYWPSEQVGQSEAIERLRKRKPLGVFECDVVPRVINMRRIDD